MKNRHKTNIMEPPMKKVIGILLLVGLTFLLAGVPLAMAETPKGPWYIFTYGIIGYAVLMVIIGLISGLGKKSK